MLQARKQNAEFVELVEKQKTEAKIAARKRKREDGGDVAAVEGAQHEVRAMDAKALKRKFKQSKVIATQLGEGLAKVDKELLQNVFKSK